MKGTRQATRRLANRTLAIPGAIMASLGVLTGCASISTPADAPDWYKNRVNEKSAKRVPRFAELVLPVAPLRTTPEWQGFGDDLVRIRAVLAARALELAVPPGEPVEIFRTRVAALIAPGLVPLANDAPPVSPPRPLPAFAE